MGKGDYAFGTNEGAVRLAGIQVKGRITDYRWRRDRFNAAILLGGHRCGRLAACQCISFPSVQHGDGGNPILVGIGKDYWNNRGANPLSVINSMLTFINPTGLQQNRLWSFIVLAVGWGYASLPRHETFTQEKYYA